MTQAFTMLAFGLVMAVIIGSISWIVYHFSAVASFIWKILKPLLKFALVILIQIFWIKLLGFGWYLAVGVFATILIFSLPTLRLIYAEHRKNRFEEQLKWRQEWERKQK